MPKSKRFIDRKKAVTFQLVHRSQQDPLIADENAPQRVLLPIADNKETASSSASHKHDQIIDEQHKYGIYYTDDSDYLSNLKDSSDNRVEWPTHVEKILQEKKVSIQLPSQVFASKREDDRGMLSRGAPISGPQLHLDPDLVAAMDEDFNFSDPDNELEDNFIELADGVASDQEFDEQYEKESDYDSNDDIRSQQSFEEEETKSRFTNYSMSSSVIKRNDQLTLLDDRFEKIYEYYDDDEIGALDCEEIEGHVPGDDHLLLEYAEEFEKTQQREQLDKDTISKKIQEQVDRNSDEDNEDFDYFQVNDKEKWDCESILSTYSNIYNHPKVIKEPRKSDRIQVSKKSGIPLNVLGADRLTQKALDRLNYENQGVCDINTGTKSTGARSVISQLSQLSLRLKNETPSERKERKNNLKEYRRERKIEKKANSLAFKEEAKRQVKITLNNKHNLQGNKIL